MIDNNLYYNVLNSEESKYNYIVFINPNNIFSPTYLALSNNNKVSGGYQFGFVSYDYKNHIEKLVSENPSQINFPDKFLFTPEKLYHFNENNNKLLIGENDELTIIKLKNETINIAFKQKVNKTTYIKNVNQIIKHIKQGDIYELNYCIEFYAENVCLNPVLLYKLLNEKSPTPFSSFVKFKDNYLICASPERFIKKDNNKLISEPIKGTVKRGQSKEEDEQLKYQLQNDEKERAENIMIVDLVRNDLAKIANKNTVHVDELCKIYTFPQVHQMISKISCKVDENISFDKVLDATFPMGSMTGAPKIKAMELIEKYETTKRGIYSGSVGYITPNNDFDFNVVIRSIMYNKKSNYLSFMVGGAITAKSNPEKEYEECLLKAKAIIEVLSNVK